MTNHALPSPAEHTRLVKFLTHKVKRRMVAAGARVVDVEDIEQEIWIAWTLARDRFDPERGVSFATYFVRGAFNHINAWMRDHERETNLTGLSLNDLAGEEDTELGELITDAEAPDAEDALVEKQCRSRVFARLTPVAAKFLALLDSPPPELFRELDAAKARFNYAKSRGVKGGPPPSSVTMSMVADLMGLDAAERRDIYKTLDKIASR